MTDSSYYAHCLNCTETFTDRDEMRAHQTDSIEPVTEIGTGVSHRGHTVQVDNPTPEEVTKNAARSTVGRAVELGLDAAFEDLYYEISKGRITKEQVKEELRSYPDFADAWDDWAEGSMD